MEDHNTNFRFGSACWASQNAMRRAGLFGRRGPLLGYAGELPIRLDSDAPMITIGGAGSGKLRDLLAYTVCGMRVESAHGGGGWVAPPRLFVNDSRGELAAISIENQVRLGKAAYCINFAGLHGLPRHRVNPLDILKPDSALLYADAKLLVASLVPLSGSANGEYFELRARHWLEMLMLHHVMQHGSITLPQLYDLVHAIQDPTQWPDIAEAMLNASIPEVRAAAIELHIKREDAPKEYGAIIGEILKSLSFLSDPRIRETLSAGDFSLGVLCERDCTVYNIIPAEYATQLAPMNRLVMGAVMLYKFRQPAAPRVLLLIDEAATLGRFDALLTAYTYGRGMGIRVHSIWQDVGQITRNFGPGALSSFLGSSQVRQFFGVRDLDTAKLISAMLGSQTLQYEPVVDQAMARRDITLWAHRMMKGASPFDVGPQCRALAVSASSRIKQARLLMSPDEILNLPEDRQILFISGINLDPVLASKYPYYTRPEMAGGYLPNPYHPPPGWALVAGRGGLRWAKVVTERVPARHANLPQYQSGEWSYVAGYRPR